MECVQLSLFIQTLLSATQNTCTPFISGKNYRVDQVIILMCGLDSSTGLVTRHVLCENQILLLKYYAFNSTVGEANNGPITIIVGDGVQAIFNSQADQPKAAIIPVYAEQYSSKGFSRTLQTKQRPYGGASLSIAPCKAVLYDAFQLSLLSQKPVISEAPYLAVSLDTPALKDNILIVSSAINNARYRNALPENIVSKNAGLACPAIRRINV